MSGRILTFGPALVIIGLMCALGTSTAPPVGATRDTTTATAPVTSIDVEESLPSGVDSGYLARVRSALSKERPIENEKAKCAAPSR